MNEMNKMIKRKLTKNIQKMSCRQTKINDDYDIVSYQKSKNSSNEEISNTDTGLFQQLNIFVLFKKMLNFNYK